MGWTKIHTTDTKALSKSDSEDGFTRFREDDDQVIIMMTEMITSMLKTQVGHTSNFFKTMDHPTEKKDYFYR